MTKYRVVEVTTRPTMKPRSRSQVVWEGVDVNRLNEQYPLHEDPEQDPLRFRINGWETIEYRFEQCEHNGTWVRCPDPRRGVLTSSS